MVRSTTDVDDSEAADYWSDVVCRTLVRVAARPASGGFSGRIEHFAVDSLGFSLVTSGAQQVERTRSLIARGREDYALLNIQIAGQGHVAQDDRGTVLSAGAMTFVDSTRPYSLWFEGAFSQLIVQVPRSVLPGRALVDATAVALSPDGPGRLIADFLTGMERQHRVDPLAVRPLAPHATGLLDSALGMCTSTRVPGQSSAALTRERVHQFIQRHAHEQELDADAVAAGCGLSRRTLFRALSDGGESFTSLLRRTRVAHVERSLRAAPNRSLAVIARQCGFAGEAQMYRAFRAVTGTTPAAYRSVPESRATAPHAQNGGHELSGQH
jgi:AraC-like DNA-binding protein